MRGMFGMLRKNINTQIVFMIRPITEHISVACIFKNEIFVLINHLKEIFCIRLHSFRIAFYRIENAIEYILQIILIKISIVDCIYAVEVLV